MPVVNILDDPNKIYHWCAFKLRKQPRSACGRFIKKPLYVMGPFISKGKALEWMFSIKNDTSYLERFTYPTKRRVWAENQIFMELWFRQLGYSKGETGCLRRK